MTKINSDHVSQQGDLFPFSSAHNVLSSNRQNKTWCYLVLYCAKCHQHLLYLPCRASRKYVPFFSLYFKARIQAKKFQLVMGKLVKIVSVARYLL